MNSHLSQIRLVFPFSLKVYMGLWGLSGKESTGHTGDTGSIPGLGRSPGEGNGTTFQYSYLKNPIDGEACQTTIHGVAKSRT